MALDFGDIGNMAKNAGELSALPKMWDDVKDKNWSDFYERIGSARQHNEADGEQLDKVETAGKQAEASGESFPHSLPDLTAIIGKHMPH